MLQWPEWWKFVVSMYAAEVRHQRNWFHICGMLLSRMEPLHEVQQTCSLICRGCGTDMSAAHGTMQLAINHLMPDIQQSHVTNEIDEWSFWVSLGMIASDSCAAWPPLISACCTIPPICRLWLSQPSTCKREAPFRILRRRIPSGLTSGLTCAAMHSYSVGTHDPQEAPISQLLHRLRSNGGAALPIQHA